jgi:hypothetical protein
MDEHLDINQKKQDRALKKRKKAVRFHALKKQKTVKILADQIANTDEHTQDKSDDEYDEEDYDLIQEDQALRKDA